MYNDTLKVSLRQIGIEDAEVLMELNNNENIADFVVGTPSVVTPAKEQVTQTGSPAKRSLYSGVRRCLTRRILSTRSSISSCAPCSVSVPSLKSLSM